MEKILLIDLAGDSFAGKPSSPRRPIVRWRAAACLAALLLLTPLGAQADYYWTNLAGQDSGLGTADGMWTDARFQSPQGITSDANGTLYVTDAESDTVRKMTLSTLFNTSFVGNVVTLAGFADNSGQRDATGLQAQFASPTGVAVDKSGNLFVADFGGDTIRMITPAGVVTTYAGRAYTPGSANGSRLTARFDGPSGVVIDTAGNLYIAEDLACDIRKIDTAGNVTVFAGTPNQFGSADGTGMVARFLSPNGLAIDAQQNIYVADTGNQTIRKITPAGMVTTIAGTPLSAGKVDGSRTQARFDSPFGVAVNGQGVVVVCELYGTTLRVIATDGSVTPLPPSIWSQETPGFPQNFNQPVALTFGGGGDGSLYVAEAGNHVVRRVGLVEPTSSTIATTYAGYPGPSYGFADGAGTAARFFNPQGAATDSAGNIYVADSYNNQVRKITPQGVVSTPFTAADFAPLYGAGNTSTFFSPVDVAIDSGGNLFVLESCGTILKITPSIQISYVVQNEFLYPQALAVDKNDNLYVTDTGRDLIEKISSTGVFSVVAGTEGVTGTTNGPVNTALFNQPAGIAVDAAGDIFVADTGNHSIRKITAGQVSTLAGWVGRFGNADGTGSSAQFCFPSGLALGSDGSLIVADTFNGQIRHVTMAGVVTTLGGYPGAQGDKPGDYRNAHFSFPYHVAVSPTGVIYVPQSAANVISAGVSGASMTLTLGGNGVGVNGQYLQGAQTASFPAGSLIDFGNVSQGYNEIATITVKNAGTTTFGNLSVTVDGGPNAGDFLVSQPAASTLAPSVQTTFTIGYKPVAARTSTAFVHVTSTGGGVNSFDFTITGIYLP